MKSRKQIRTDAEKSFASHVCGLSGVDESVIIVKQMIIVTEHVYCVEVTYAEDADALVKACADVYKIERRGLRIVMFWPLRKEA